MSFESSGKLDPHSVSNTDAFKITHLNWSARVDFDSQTITAVAEYTIQVQDAKHKASELRLDSTGINVTECLIDGTNVVFELFEGRFGGGLKVFIPADLASDQFKLSISYSTTKRCSAAQWLLPNQTLGGNFPFMFTQCQAIHARSLIPVQDTPSIKFTYNATVEVPEGLIALMSAQRGNQLKDKVFTFNQPLRIPSYLLALAVGNLEGRQIGPRSTVWAEPALVAAAAAEFIDTETFLLAAEHITGPYVWGIYDLLVLPASFPYGGMENPCLTFLSPSLIAGDKSLVDVVVHEIAHSWTGNLVTNADWSSFWLNEGFTMFLERRITGQLRGQPYRHFDACLGLIELKRDVFDLFGADHPATALCPDMENLDPDDAYSRVPYEKGHTFLFFLESVVNEGVDQEQLGPFGEYLKSYFKEFANKSLTVAQWKEHFLLYFQTRHQKIYERLNAKVDFGKWLFGAGMPPVVPKYEQQMCQSCRNLASLYHSLYLFYML